MRVLIVEDDADQRKILAMVVRGHGHEAIECATLAEARAAEACDLALVDRKLPDGDGLDLVRALPNAYLLTGDDGPHDDVRVLVKPVRPAELDALLR